MLSQKESKNEVKDYFCPKGYPLIGQIPNINGNFLLFMENFWKEHGDHVCVDLGVRKMRLIVHPEDVKHVCIKNIDNYYKDYGILKEFLGDGLLLSHGAQWKKQRRLMNPMFTRKSMKDYVGVMQNAALRLLKRWESFNMSEPFNMLHELTYVTQDVIASAMFSEALGEQVEELCHALEVAMKCLDKQMLMPKFMTRLPLPNNRRFRKASRLVRERMEAIIDEHIKYPEKYDDLLTLLLQAKDPETGESMSREDIIDEVSTIFFAGHETTANTLAWAFFMLDKHPEVAEKVYREVDEVLGDDLPGLEEVQKLKYTRMVIDEVLRLFPVAWMVSRTAKEEDILPTGYRIPKGQTVNVAPYLTHRHPDFWEEPDKFWPERFSSENSKQIHKSAYYPFLMGQRICIGNHFSLLEAPLILAMIVQRYKAHLVPGEKVEIKPMATLRPNPGLPMFLEKRTDKAPKVDFGLPTNTAQAASGCPFHSEQSAA